MTPLLDRLGRPVKHGKTGTPEHRAWVNMVFRCHNPSNPRYARYGGRGISVCRRWLESFEAFHEDMGPRPSAAHSLDRINNDGNYEPGNCRWATCAEQNRNRSDCVILEHDGQRMTIAEWAHRLGMGPKTLGCRLRAGRSVPEALTLPVALRRSKGGRRRFPKSEVVLPTPETPKYRGVYWHSRGAWEVYVFLARRERRYVGSFPDPESGALAHDQMARELFGEDAILNFPDRDEIQAEIDAEREGGAA